jgi:catechol 2,3-dioxygenase-like lactoylglutathione lyase family enzyme
LTVADLEASIDFYTRLFGAEPAKRRPGYANFAIAEPPLKLVLIEGRQGQATVMDHLGVEVESAAHVTGAASRLAAEGLAAEVEQDTACCCHLQGPLGKSKPTISPHPEVPGCSRVSGRRPGTRR